MKEKKTKATPNESSWTIFLLAYIGDMDVLKPISTEVCSI